MASPLRSPAIGSSPERPLGICVRKATACPRDPRQRQQDQPLAALFGAADVSSSDGQHFPTAGPGEAVGAVNAHYERNASALFYTHLSARQAPYNTVAISPSGEAAHVIERVLHHEADLSITTHHTDGRGVSDHVFALAYLLGFHFAPRIPNLAERLLYTLGPANTSPMFETFIVGHVDEKLINGPLERCLAFCDLGPHWDSQRFAPPQAPRRLSAPERAGPRLERNRSDRAHAVHTRLVRAAGTLPAGDRGAQQRRGALRPPPSAFTASVDWTIARPRGSNIVQAGSRSSPLRSRSGTRCTSAARLTNCAAAAKSSRTPRWPTLPQSGGSTSISPATICGILTEILAPTASGRFARRQQSFTRPSPPDRVRDLVLRCVRSWPFYGVTPINDESKKCAKAECLQMIRAQNEHPMADAAASFLEHRLELGGRIQYDGRSDPGQQAR